LISVMTWWTGACSTWGMHKPRIKRDRSDVKAESESRPRAYLKCSVMKPSLQA
jgi:hypothetical protein